jgi:hypothetical protein
MLAQRCLTALPKERQVGLATKNSTPHKVNRKEASYVGGWVSSEEKAQAQALAAIHGTSVQGLLRMLIGRAAKSAQLSMADASTLIK